MERLLFRRELRAKRREVSAAMAADIAWREPDGFGERIRSGEEGVLNPWKPLHVRAGVMRIQAVWRGVRGRVQAAEAVQQLKEAVTQRLEEQAAAQEIQQHWRAWRQQRGLAQITGGAESAGLSEQPEQGTAGWQSPDLSNAQAWGTNATTAGDDDSRGGSGNQRRKETDDREGWDDVSHQDDESEPPAGTEADDNDEQCLPEADLVCARILQLKKMSVQLLWVQPEPEVIDDDVPNSALERRRRRRKRAADEKGDGSSSSPMRVALRSALHPDRRAATKACSRRSDFPAPLRPPSARLQARSNTWAPFRRRLMRRFAMAKS